MTKKLMLHAVMVLGAVVALARCGDSEAANRGPGHEYEVVGEGSANGVSSTIQAPGETVPPLTSTNMDTTTAFTVVTDSTATAVSPLPPMIGTQPYGTTPYGVPPGSTPPPVYSGTPTPASPRPIEIRRSTPPASSVTRETPPATTTSTTEQPATSTQEMQPVEQEQQPPENDEPEEDDSDDTSEPAETGTGTPTTTNTSGASGQF